MQANEVEKARKERLIKLSYKIADMIAATPAPPRHDRLEEEKDDTSSSPVFTTSAETLSLNHLHPQMLPDTSSLIDDSEKPARSYLEL